MEKKTVLFVCTGNSCRSVIAEELFKKMLQKAVESAPSGKDVFADIEVVSAGVASLSGMNPPPGTVRVMEEEGIDVSAHRAIAIDSDAIEKASLIVVMEKRHRDEIVDMVPDSRDRVVLLGRFGENVSEGEPDVPDPIGHSLDVYKRCTLEIRQCLHGLLDEILSGKVKL